MCRAQERRRKRDMCENIQVSRFRLCFQFFFTLLLYIYFPLQFKNNLHRTSRHFPSNFDMNINNGNVFSGCKCVCMCLRLHSSNKQGYGWKKKFSWFFITLYLYIHPYTLVSTSLSLLIKIGTEKQVKSGMKPQDINMLCTCYNLRCTRWEFWY